jgi:hypothetical protein
MAALEKALITNTVTGDDVEVMFNPEAIAFQNSNTFAQMTVPGLRSPLLQFVNGNLKTLELELFVDTYEEHRSGSKILNVAKQDAREITKRITDLLEIAPETHAPPVLLFTWGEWTLRCVLASASERYVMFLPSGIPVRAHIQVTFNEFTNAEFEAKQIKRETADYSRFYVVGDGETLSSIAWNVYQNAENWRPIAIRNGIDNPRSLRTGDRLLIPQLPFTDVESGEVYA